MDSCPKGANVAGTPALANAGAASTTEAILDTTERILEQGKALVRVIEALGTIDHTGWLERSQVWLLLQAYRRRLRAIAALAPHLLAEETLSASLEVGKDRATAWLSEN